MWNPVGLPPQCAFGSIASIWRCPSHFRGRDASYLAPPAQIRTGPIRAYGSHLGCLTAKLAVCAPAPVTRFPGTVPGPCFADAHSPRPPPLAPPTPQPVARLCSLASQLLWRGQTFHLLSSSRTVPHPSPPAHSHNATTARRPPA